MSRRLSRISLAFVLLLSSEVWALGLGDIKLESALGEPLRAEIELLSATPSELDNLSVSLASAETFARYGLDRPYYLQEIEFEIVRSGRADGNAVQVRSRAPMAEPFLTFLVEANWSSGRLLREYTVLLDPPTYAPPVSNVAPAVQAPGRTRASDAGQIERRLPAPEPAPEPEPVLTEQAPAAEPAPAVREPAVLADPVVAEPVYDEPISSEPAAPAASESPYDTAAGGDYTVQASETLWGIASRVRPDSRLTMNQTMMAIFEANPDAFGGNINILRAGASLRIPSADEIFQISRGDALDAAQRQHDEWGGDSSAARPSLTLVPPDDDYAAETPAVDTGYDAEPYTAEPLSREQEIEQRIAELEATDVPQQPSLIEIRDNELASLRQELARLRGEVYEPPVAEPEPVAVEPAEADEAATVDAAGTADDAPVDTTAAVEEPAQAEAEPEPSTIIRAPAAAEPGLMDKLTGMLGAWWMIILGVLVIAAGVLFGLRRLGGTDGEEAESAEPWQLPEDDDEEQDPLAATESLAAPTPADDDAIVVIEEEPVAESPSTDETVEAATVIEPSPVSGFTDSSGTFNSLEDTFSSDTAINLDQSDPLAEADFHMAYGLYDQAADLVNGALESEPEREDLLTKLAEIYFVWGNRDEFVAAASRLKATVGDGENANWDKIIIMGQQIAADDELFTGASAAAQAVDLELDEDAGEDAALDMELLSETGEIKTDIVDLGGEQDDDSLVVPPFDDTGGVDFLLDDEEKTDVVEDEQSEIDVASAAGTEGDIDFVIGDDEETEFIADDSAEVADEAAGSGVDVLDLDAVLDLPAADETVDSPTIEATVEIDVDELDLDVSGLPDVEEVDDVEVTTKISKLKDADVAPGAEDSAGEIDDSLKADLSETGFQPVISAGEVDSEGVLGDTTGIHSALEESLLEATGVTHILEADMVEAPPEAEDELEDAAATILAELEDEIDTSDSGDEPDILIGSFDEDTDIATGVDFARTEALPKEAFADHVKSDETAEAPAIASTDMDLDLDDLTAALQVSEIAEDELPLTDDGTKVQPRPDFDDAADDVVPTMSLAPDDLSADLQEARTMTEVGTKLDLARAYVDMGDPSGARSILEEVLDEGDDGQRQQAQQLLESLPS
jgi:pilus assembly protein FimV